MGQFRVGFCGDLLETDADDGVFVGESRHEGGHGVVGGFVAEEAHYERGGDAESAVSEL